MSEFKVSYDDDPGAIKVLYEITNIFLQPVIKADDLLPQYLIEKEVSSLQDIKEILTENAQEILLHNTWIIVCGSLGLIFALVSLAMGCLFCCCCDKSGREEKDYSHRKYMLSFLGFLQTLIAILGVSWFWLSIVRLDSGLDNVNKTSLDIMHDIHLYLYNTRNEIVEVINQTAEASTVEIDNVGSNYSVLIKDLREDTQLDVIEGNVELFQDFVKNYTTNLQPVLKDLRETNDKIRDHKVGLERICPTQACGKLSSNLNELHTKTDKIVSLPNLPENIGKNLEKVKQILSNVDENIDKGDIGEELSVLKDQINSLREKFVKNLDQGLDELGLSGLNSSYSQDLKGRNSGFSVELKRMFDSRYKKISANFKYIVISQVIGAVLALTLVIITFAVLFGCGSKQGSKAAMTCASTISYSFSIFLGLAVILFTLCVALFLFGAFVEKAICLSLRDPDHSQVFQLLDKLPKSCSNKSLELKISEVIAGIHQNTPIYRLLQLEVCLDVKDLKNWKEEFKTSEKIEELKKGVAEIAKLKDDLLSSSILNDAHSIDDDVNPFVPLILEFNTTTIEDHLKEIEDLNESPAMTVVKSSMQDLVEELRNWKVLIKSLQKSLVVILNSPLGQDQQLRIEVYEEETLTLIDKAFLKITPAVTGFLDSSVQRLLHSIDIQIDRTVSAVEEDIGKTEPLSNIYNATYTFLCQDIVAPFNSVWSGLGFTLLVMSFPLFSLSFFLIKIFRSTLPERVQAQEVQEETSDDEEFDIENEDQEDLEIEDLEDLEFEDLESINEVKNENDRRTRRSYYY